jgi:predicted secreted acid phosphatase
MDISPIDFNISPNDGTYQALYLQGYSAAKTFFTSKQL